MIVGADQYEYVTGANADDEHPHGDLDRIEITGSPINLSDNHALRGEKIATLAEWATQRTNCLVKAEYMSDGVWTARTTSAVDAATFSRVPTKAAVVDLQARFQKLQSFYFFPKRCNVSGLGASPWVTASQMSDEAIAAHYDASRISMTWPSVGETIAQTDVADYYSQVWGHVVRGNGAGMAIASSLSGYGVTLASPFSSGGGVVRYHDGVTASGGNAPERGSQFDLAEKYAWGYSKVVYSEPSAYAGCTMEGSVEPYYPVPLVRLTTSSHVASVVGLQRFTVSGSTEACVYNLQGFDRVGDGVFETSAAYGVQQLIEMTGVSPWTETFSGAVVSRTRVYCNITPILFFDTHTDY